VLGPTPIRPDSFERARAALASRLAARQEEIEEAVLTRILAVSDANESQDPEYVQGLRAASAVAVRYALAVIEAGEDRTPKPPPVLLAQARLAARNGVGLDTVLRRYSAGYVIFADFLVEEAERGGLRASELQRLMRSQAVLDQLLAAIGEEHGREGIKRPTTSEERRAERIERLLAGELLDTSGLAYEFEGHHIGLIAKGPGAQEALKALATALDRRLLAIGREDGAVWAWLGSHREIDIEELQRHLSANWPVQATLAFGEPGEGLSAWRLTHRQARAALPIALRSPEPFVRYADVALLAAILKDELLATSLRRLYLEPLEAERDGGEVLRETLRAYFAAGCNVSSAAVVLGVSRQAVAKRLRAVEERLGRSLDGHAAELEVALRIQQLDAAAVDVR
jgi:hypothetical protein